MRTYRSQPHIGDGEIGVEFNRHLIRRDGFRLPALKPLLVAFGVGLQGSERRGGCLFDRGIEFLNGDPRFIQELPPILEDGGAGFDPRLEAYPPLFAAE
jgi:hypothetical protein